jgi:Heparinase II/III-like protein
MPHADKAFFGQRWIMALGCSTCACDEKPRRQCASAAHQIVVIDGQDSSETRSCFRVAHPSRPQAVCAACHDRRVIVQGAHGGYRCAATGTVHPWHPGFTRSFGSTVVMATLNTSFAQMSFRVA